jgi:hypothetical protein
MLAADPVDVVVTIPPGALTRTIPVSVEVQSTQSRHVIDPGYVLSLHGVTLSLATDALSESGSVAIRLPFVGTYDGTTPSLTMMMAEAKDGNRLALSATRSGESQLTGQLDAATIQALDMPQITAGYSCACSPLTGPLRVAPSSGRSNHSSRQPGNSECPRNRRFRYRLYQDESRCAFRDCALTCKI